MRLSALEGSHEAENGRSEGIEKEIADSEEQIAKLTDAKNRAERTVSDYGQAIDNEKNALDAKKRGLEELNGGLEKAREELSALCVSADGKRQRAEALSRMDELLEGYNYSVKNVMRAAGSGQVRGI